MGSPGRQAASASRVLNSAREAEVGSPPSRAAASARSSLLLDVAPASAVSPLLAILWFGPCGAFFRPGRLILKPARAAAVKDGRHADLTPRSTASRPLLAGPSTTALWRGTGTQDHNQARCPSIAALASPSKYA